MIDMSDLYEHNDYQEALNRFNISNCKWSFFKEIQMKVSKNRCPICEYLFDEESEIVRENRKGENLLVPTVDHYRPQEYYPFLKCNHKNYLLMCFECNSSYKKSKFPIYNSLIRATTHQEVIDEKPLIVNPISDDIYELFTLVFKRNGNKDVLELKPKVSSGYLYAKALKTIEIFGLGNCEEYRHLNNEIHNCRIRLLVSHFGKFYKYAEIMKTPAKELLKERIKNRIGFWQFIYREQFEIENFDES